ncbi:hypothetical protein KJS94_10190 [Flavihumibacter rivuli]|uniref:CBU_0592 family membrane protein n=1 Tax=Flavihumibacter rivuli TaxID=2838156 RepID=UPI001BDE0CC6|nr:hypothetical protein [Flavihumibacter rivuli]ULQ55007.1 hypothetical protein KJS94_10190 [Flavihumibacter rivuli]
MKKELLLEIIGWLGGGSVMIAYMLNAFRLLDAGSPVYLLVNIIGSILLAYYTYCKKAFPNLVLNLVWALVAILALMGIKP